MKVLFFAQARDATGCMEQEFSLERPLSISEFWQRLREKFPALGPLEKTARLARKESYLDPGETLRPEDEIAVIPPVSGG